MSLLHPFRHAIASEDRGTPHGRHLGRGTLSPVESRRWLSVGPPLCALIVVATVGACTALVRSAWLDLLPVPNVDTGVVRELSRLRTNPVPGASGQEYTYPEWDFGLIPSE
jgi:hypothetical protein